MNISDLFDPALLQQMLEERMVRIRVDEELPVLVYDYTERAQFSRTWNPVTMTCRGLLVHAETGDIVARALPKFFNYGETGAATIGTGPVEVYDKLDGSLGILYPVPGTDRYRISTRGSLRSPQANVGTNIWNAKYAKSFTPNPAWTYLFEIIAPSTRVVIDYKGLSDLILIGAIETATGATVPFEEAQAGWPGPVVEKFSYATLLEALAAPQRPNAEGFVILDPATGNRVKLKQEDYKLLHGVITGLRKLDLWELLAVEANPDLSVKTAGVRFKMSPESVTKLRESPAAGMDAVLARVPDELYPHVQDAIREIVDGVNDLHKTLREEYLALGIDATDRKAGAFKIREAAGSDKLRSSIWMQMMSGGEYVATIWRHLRPDPFAYVMDTYAGSAG